MFNQRAKRQRQKQVASLTDLVERTFCVARPVAAGANNTG